MIRSPATKEPGIVFSMSSGFGRHTGRMALYLQDHVDTDRIIPARFLSMVSKAGYGELLFADVRKQESDFPLDQAAAQGASIMVVGTNFGCGSSREHAVWAIQQAGFVAVIARVEAASPGYSDIFRQNAANCGMLLVELGHEAHTAFAAAGSGAQVTIDLPGQTVEVSGQSFGFEINPATKQQLMAGLDLVGTTLTQEGDIAAFEHRWHSFSPTTSSR